GDAGLDHGDVVLGQLEDGLAVLLERGVELRGLVRHGLEDRPAEHGWGRPDPAPQGRRQSSRAPSSGKRTTTCTVPSTWPDSMAMVRAESSMAAKAASSPAHGVGTDEPSPSL